MFTLTLFAVCFTALLLVMGTTYTFVEFYRAEKRMRAAPPVERRGHDGHGRGA